MSIRLFYKHQIRLVYKHQTIIQAPGYYTNIRLLYKHQTIIQEADSYTSILLSYHIIRSSYHIMRSSSHIIRSAYHIFFRGSGWHWETCSKMRCRKTIKVDLNRVQVAPFGPTLCQNVAPRLRIIFQPLLEPKNNSNKSKKNEMLKILIFTKAIHHI